MKLMNLQKGATVITDASWCPDLRVAGYGCWIAMNGVKSQGFSGPIQMKPESSNQAELMAAAIGITIAHQTFGATEILIQSDCIAVGNLIRKPTVRREYLAHIETPLSLRFKHTPIGPERRFEVYRWCDKQAGIWMRKERQRHAS